MIGGFNMDEKIEELSLIDLKKYACPKNQHKNDWYWDCLNDCPGFATCKVGHRVMAILDDATKENAPASGQTEKQKAYSERRRVQARERCKEAIESGDPVKWLIEHGHKELAAKRLIQDWQVKFYDLFGLDKPREKKEITPARKAAFAARREALIARVDTAIASGDVKKWLINQGKTPSQAQDTYYDWKRKFPEKFVEEKAPIQAAEAEEDEISVASFLAEFEGEETPVEAVVEVPEEEIPVPVETGVVPQLNAKYMELSAERDRLEAEIRERQGKMTQLKQQMEALVNVLDLFGCRASDVGGQEDANGEGR